MVVGLELPFLTEAHPDLLGEGNLDPLGLARIADRLAEELLPDVTARMRRIRFLTLIVAGAHAIEDLHDIPSADRVTTPEIALEWHIAEAFARERGLPPVAREGLPGIAKARAALARNARLDGPSYLRAPRTFGFFGVYRRLAVGTDLLDSGLMLKARGEQLLRAWEEDHPAEAEGFVDRRRGTPGGYMESVLRDAAKQALLAGRATHSLHGVRDRIVHAFRLDGIGARERRLLMDALRDPLKMRRREVIDGLRRHDPGDTESDELLALREGASTELRTTIDAIEAYERVCGLVLAAFTAAQVVSTSTGWATVAQIAKHKAVSRCANKLPQDFRTAVGRVEPLGLAGQADLLLGGLAHAAEQGPEALIEALMSHHELIQLNKPPGKRPWFERSEHGFYVRLPYRLEDDLPPGYIHPYRVLAIRGFLEDLR
jgi:hypothetical protein